MGTKVKYPTYKFLSDGKYSVKNTPKIIVLMEDLVSVLQFPTQNNYPTRITRIVELLWLSCTIEGISIPITDNL